MLVNKKVAALIVAAGRGTRMGGQIPKQFQHLAGKPVIAWSVQSFRKAGVEPVFIVIDPEYRDAFAGLLATLLPTALIDGGKERQDSVRLGLEAIAAEMPDITHVMIHDAARPLASPQLIELLGSALDTAEGVIPAIAITDSLKKIDMGHVAASVSREHVMAAQTPQAFALSKILEAHRKLRGEKLTDDAALFEAMGWKISVINGEIANIKLTTAEDWRLVEKMMQKRTAVGFGYDVHKLLPHEAGKETVIRLGGIDIPHDAYLEGFSDADVVLHAIVDAILGALAMGDIGTHFPPGVPQWKGADSAVFVAEVKRLMEEREASLEHLDITIIGEKPKISPHRDAMRERIAQLLGMGIERVSLKATTTEGLDFTGREEGLAAHAVATLLVA